MYIPKHLKLHEVFAPECYDNIKNNYGNKAWKFWDINLLIAADQLRERYGAVTCNNWKAGGHLRYRGFRPHACKVGSMFSAHRFFKALDLNFKDATAEEIRQDIKNFKIVPPINRIEDNVSWLHLDTYNGKKTEDIYFFKP